MAITEKNRIEFIDLAKGICITLVVALHAVPELDIYLPFLPYMRMPLYFCLSGLFYKDYGSFKNFTIKKLNNILIPFVAWYVIGCVIYFIGRKLLPGDHEAEFYFGDVLFQNSIYNLPIWFLMSLFWSNILFAIVNLISKKWYWQFPIVVGFALIGLAFSHFRIFNFLYIGMSMTSMPFFFMGYMLKKTALLYPSESKKRDFIIMCLFLMVGLFFAFWPDDTPTIIYFSNKIEGGHQEIFYICGISFVVSLLLLSKFIKHVPFITWIGRYSIIVLVTHSLLINLFRPLLLRTPVGNLERITVSLIVLALVFLIMFFVIPFCIK